LFESLPKEDARKWTGEFIEAIPVGVSYEQFNSIRDRFQIFWLERQQTQIDAKKYPKVNEAIQTVIDLLTQALKGIEPESAAWSAAKLAARSAAFSAARLAAFSAARLAAESAAWAEAQVKRDWILTELRALK
jgi:MoxR-like ATPase